MRRHRRATALRLTGDENRCQSLVTTSSSAWSIVPGRAAGSAAARGRPAVSAAASRRITARSWIDATWSAPTTWSPTAVSTSRPWKTSCFCGRQHPPDPPDDGAVASEDGRPPTQRQIGDRVSVVVRRSPALSCVPGSAPSTGELIRGSAVPPTLRGRFSTGAGAGSSAAAAAPRCPPARSPARPAPTPPGGPPVRAQPAARPRCRGRHDPRRMERLQAGRPLGVRRGRPEVEDHRPLAEPRPARRR